MLDTPFVQAALKTAWYFCNIVEVGVVVFVDNKSGVQELMKKAEDDEKWSDKLCFLHGDMSQPDRYAQMEKYKANRCILFGTPNLLKVGLNWMAGITEVFIMAGAMFFFSGGSETIDRSLHTIPQQEANTGVKLHTRGQVQPQKSGNHPEEDEQHQCVHKTTGASSACMQEKITRPDGS